MVTPGKRSPERSEWLTRERPEAVERERPEAVERGFAVMRCSACGDTFPVDEVVQAGCRTCGSKEVARAAEPLL